MAPPAAPEDLAALRAAGLVVLEANSLLRRSGTHHMLGDHPAAGAHMIEPACLQPMSVMGEGGWATVEKAWYTPAPGAPRQLVAVKRPKPAVFADPAQHDMWTAEVELMSKLQHECIVGFVGAGAGLECGELERAFLVQELMEGGTLKSLVQRQMLQNPTPLYSDAAGLDICLQVARGLRYMHMAQPMVMHRDLKLDNIMLTSIKASPEGAWTAKIVDFGLSKVVAEQRQRVLCRLLTPGGSAAGAGKHTLGSPGATAAILVGQAGAYKAGDDISGPLPQGGDDAPDSAPRDACEPSQPALSAPLSLACSDDPSSPLHRVVVDNSQHGERFAFTAETGSLMYMAPEVFKGEAYNEKADVFAFGMVMHEVMHRYTAISAICVQGTVAELEAYARGVAGGYRPPIDAKWPPELAALIQDCWAHDPAERPSMQEVVPRLQALKDRDLLSHYVGRGATCCTIC